MNAKTRSFSLPNAFARSREVFSKAHCSSRIRCPSADSGGSGIRKNAVSTIDTLMPFWSKIPRASRIFSIGWEVLYGPQMFRTSAQPSPYWRRTLAAVRTSSSISSVVTPSLICESGSARKRPASRANAAPPSHSRRLWLVMPRLSQKTPPATCANRSPTHAPRTRFLLLPRIVADPRLRTPKQRKTQIAPHRELAPPIDEAHLATVHRAILGVEDVASGVLVAVFLHSANDHHAGHRLALAFVAALVADLDRVRIDQRFHAAKKQPLLFVQQDDGLSLSGLIVAGPPAAGGRGRGVGGP